MTNKTALVTGASSGIGAIFAQELAHDGYAVTCVARSQEKLQDLAAKPGSNHRVLVADLSDSSQLQRVAGDLENTRYSLLVNNAGYGIYGRFDEIPADLQEHMMFVNMNVLVRLSHAFLKNARPGDALINVSSIVARMPYPGGAVYSGTKGFVSNFTESLWYEYKDRGVYIMDLLPGVTKTNFFAVATGGRIKAEPRGPMYPAETVVKDALAALRKRKAPSVITGPKYRLLTFLATKLVSRKRLITLIGRGSAGMNI
jgi:short-subunit dehydrogenase